MVPSLYKAIREKCAQQGWYGPDISFVTEHDSRTSRFAFPPATEAQLCTAEKVLGFSLPQALRGLYAHVANGGFGPGYGLRGVTGGASAAGGTLEEWYSQWVEHFVVEEIAPLKPGEERLLPRPLWPAGLISILEWGCGIQVGMLHNTIVEVGPVEGGYVLTYRARSLEAYLHQWVQSREPLDRLREATEVIPSF
jgi:hypothetical protein